MARGLVHLAWALLGAKPLTSTQQSLANAFPPRLEPVLAALRWDWLGPALEDADLWKNVVLFKV